MKPNESTKERIFYQIAQYLHAGIPLPQAVSQFATAAASGRVRRVLNRLNQTLDQGVGAGFLATGFSSFDVGMIVVGERSGRLAEAFQLLAIHYARRVKWRSAVVSKLIYPVVLLHLAVLLLAIPFAIMAQDSEVYVRIVLTLLGGLYAGVGLLWGVWRLLKRIAQRSEGGGRIMGAIPWVGGWIRTVVSGRFAQALAGQLQAGVPVVSACQAAAVASGNRALQAECRRMEARVRQGAGLAEAFRAQRGRSGLVPDLIEAMAIGEQMGRLDQQCLRVAEELDFRLQRRAEWMGEWLPRLLYFGVAGGVAWMLVHTLRTVYSQVGAALGG